MAIGIEFSKRRAVQVLGCISKGVAISPASPSGWTAHDALAVAGALIFAAADGGPFDRKVPNNLPREHAEAVAMTLRADILMAVRYYADLTRLVRDGGYDAKFEPECRAVVTTDNGRVELMPVKGFKDLA